MEGAARNFYSAEFELFEKITKISGSIKHQAKGEQRKKACFKALNEVRLEQIAYLPSNPDAILLEIDYASAAPMQSAAKAPFLARFKIRHCGVKEMEGIAMSAYQEVGSNDEFSPQTAGDELQHGKKKHHFPHYHRRSSKQLSSSPLPHKGKHRRQASRCLQLLASLSEPDNDSAKEIGWKSAIFKVGDDVRQGMNIWAGVVVVSCKAHSPLQICWLCNSCS